MSDGTFADALAQWGETLSHKWTERLTFAERRRARRWPVSKSDSCSCGLCWHRRDGGRYQYGKAGKWCACGHCDLARSRPRCASSEWQTP